MGDFLSALVQIILIIKDYYIYMKSLQKFLFEQRGDIMSDDAVYYEISMHKYKRPQVKPYWDKDYNIKNLSGSEKRCY